jgi:GGDEF domain-containing protein
VLLPGVGCEEASQISRRAAATVRSLREVLQLPSRTSASWGIASFPEDAKDADDLLRKADARLYAAKRAGGDRVAFGDLGVAMLAQPLEPGAEPALTSAPASY